MGDMKSMGPAWLGIRFPDESSALSTTHLLYIPVLLCELSAWDSMVGIDVLSAWANWL
jgi:hypothetical protein